MQDCQTGGLKKTFPDIDYSFYGYNILKGYPLADGRDPGFTRPLFAFDFSKGGHTADCRCLFLCIKFLFAQSFVTFLYHSFADISPMLIMPSCRIDQSHEHINIKYKYSSDVFFIFEGTLFRGA